MKIVTSLALLCLFGVSLHGMESDDDAGLVLIKIKGMTAQEKKDSDEFEKLFDDALVDDGRVTAFTEYVALNTLDVDTIRYGTESVGQYLARSLSEDKYP